MKMKETKYNKGCFKSKPSSGIVTPGFSSPHFCGVYSGCKYPSRYSNPYKKKNNDIVYIEHDESVPEITG